MKVIYHMLAYDLKKGMIIRIPECKEAEDVLVIASVSSGMYKNFLLVRFEGGHSASIPRSMEVDVCPDECDACGKVDDNLSYYDNGIYGHSGWMCGDCISTAEMEL